MLTRSNILVLTPDRDTAAADGSVQHDFTGAFLPESQKFAALHSVPVENICRVDPTMAMDHRLEKVLGALTRVTSKAPIDAIAIFSHGWALGGGGVQVGLRRADLTHFCAVWGPHLAPDVVVALFCCLTGDGEGDQLHGPGGATGFAWTLREALASAGNVDCQVFAHSTLGHTTANPYVRVFRGATPGAAGEFVVDPDGPLFARWRELLGEYNPAMWRLKYPFMSAAEIEAALSGSGRC